MMLRRAQNDMIDASDAAEQIENAEATDPIEPTDRTDPIEPIDSTEPFEPIDSSESSDQRDHFEVCASPFIGGSYVKAIAVDGVLQWMVMVGAGRGSGVRERRCQTR